MPRFITAGPSAWGNAGPTLALGRTGKEVENGAGCLGMSGCPGRTQLTSEVSAERERETSGSHSNQPMCQGKLASMPAPRSGVPSNKL